MESRCIKDRRITINALLSFWFGMVDLLILVFLILTLGSHPVAVLSYCILSVILYYTLRNVE